MKTDKTSTKERFIAALVSLLMYWITLQMMVPGFQRVPDAVPRLVFTLSWWCASAESHARRRGRWCIAAEV